VRISGRWGQAHVRGLLLDGRRKSVEWMAARLGEDGNRQALAHFITSSPWDPAHARARLAWRMQEAIGVEALIVDDTGFLKDGDASACVSRKYTGTAGKVTKCQVGVSLHLASDRASAAVNWRLFLQPGLTQAVGRTGLRTAPTPQATASSMLGCSFRACEPYVPRTTEGPGRACRRGLLLPYTRHQPVPQVLEGGSVVATAAVVATPGGSSMKRSWSLRRVAVSERLPHR
jgi:hypothetical protein